jgi:hypothetical protein
MSRGGDYPSPFLESHPAHRQRLVLGLWPVIQAGQQVAMDVN